MSHARVSRPALAYVGMALHEAPFNEDAEQRPLGEVKTLTLRRTTLLLLQQGPRRGDPATTRVTARCLLVAYPDPYFARPLTCRRPQSVFF